jgi:hypothetical protein
MKPFNSRVIFAPWVFVLTGVIFNVISAVVMHYFIGLNNDKINGINSKINNQQVLFDSLWQSKTEIERKQEFYILFLTSADKSDLMVQEVLAHYRDYLMRLIDSHGLTQFTEQLNTAIESNIQLLLDVGTQSQKKIIQSINNTYFEILDLDAQKNPIEKNNALLYSIAIFLQVIGLILVLARDLRR